jgi:Asp-tRNA(Asn)/Glu-tRNA(Gln) amidotransferase B subunit
MPLSVGGQLPLQAVSSSVKSTNNKKSQHQTSTAAAAMESRVLRLNRIQLEQDSGKTLLEDHGCLVDLNRAGVTLVEFVFEPDLRRCFF